MASSSTTFARPNSAQIAGPGWFKCFEYSTSTGFQSDAPMGSVRTIPQIEELVAQSGVLGGPHLREKVAALPMLDCRTGLDPGQQRRAFTILSLVSHGYIWGDGKMKVFDRLPPQLAVPLLTLGYQLGLTPLATYASTVLWNCSIADPRKGWVPENVQVELTFTGSWDEKWFFATSACIEVEGAAALNSLISIVAHMSTATAIGGPHNDWLVATLFRAFWGSMERMTVLSQSLERIDPEALWNVRPYFAGWSQVRSSGCSRKGVRYEGIDNPDETREYDGVSIHQSSLYQCLDAVLGVSHAPQETEALEKARLHMPGKHRSMVEAVEVMFGGILQSLAKEGPVLANAYDCSVEAVARFKAVHSAAANQPVVAKSRSSKKSIYGSARKITRVGLPAEQRPEVKDFRKGAASK